MNEERLIREKKLTIDKKPLSTTLVGQRLQWVNHLLLVDSGGVELKKRQVSILATDKIKLINLVGIPAVVPTLLEFLPHL